MSTVMKPVSLTDSSCLVSLPSLFTTPSRLPSLLSLPSKPINLILSSSSYPSLRTKTQFSSPVAFVASEWAQQGEENETTVAVDEEEQTESDGVDAEATLSDWGEAAADSGEGEEEDSEPNEEAKLYVGNLPYDVDSQSLAMLFEKVGTVEIAEVIYNRETEQSRGFGFITMSTVEEAEKAAETFNGYDINGRLLTVNKASPRGSRIERPPRVFEQSFRVYVGNLPWEVDNARLDQVFSEHGKVVDARVVYDRETGRSRGFGFVTMSTETEMNDAIAALDGQSLEGRAIRVNVAEQKPRQSSF